VGNRSHVKKTEFQPTYRLFTHLFPRSSCVLAFWKYRLTMPETTPLLSNSEGANYYFLNNGTEGKPSSFRGADRGAIVEGLPNGSDAAEFEPKKLGPKRQVGRFRIPCCNNCIYGQRRNLTRLVFLSRFPLDVITYSWKCNQLVGIVANADFSRWWAQVVAPAKENEREPSFFSKLFSKKKADHVKAPSMVKQRKAPIKVEPKVFFANERTFLAWMHISIILAGASIAILAFSGSSENPGSQIYGVVMLPVAVAFIVYSMYQCKYRTHHDLYH